VKAKLFWSETLQKVVTELKHHLYYEPMLTFPEIQKPFEIGIDASNYTVGLVLTQQWHLVAYHSETLSDTVQKYPTYDKEMYSFVQLCCQWKNYIVGMEMIIHIDQQPL